VPSGPSGLLDFQQQMLNVSAFTKTLGEKRANG
jgi:hypothetical protein